MQNLSISHFISRKLFGQKKYCDPCNLNRNNQKRGGLASFKLSFFFLIILNESQSSTKFIENSKYYTCVFCFLMFVTLLFEIMYLLFRWSSSLTNFTNPNYKVFLVKPVLVINRYTSFLKIFVKIGVGIPF